MADISQTASSVLKLSGAARQAPAGETLIAGQPVYMLNGLLYKAKADTAAHANAVGITLNGGALNQPVDYVGDGGSINIGATMANGGTYCVSRNNAGGICLIADIVSGDFSFILGTATGAGVLPLNFINAGVARA